MKEQKDAETVRERSGAEVSKERQKELEVITLAKKLCEYAYVITKKTPKEYRWNIVDKILKGTLELVEKLYEANDLKGNERLRCQREVDTKLKVIGWFGTVAEIIDAFTHKQVETFGSMALETRRALWKWIKSERIEN